MAESTSLCTIVRRARLPDEEGTETSPSSRMRPIPQPAARGSPMKRGLKRVKAAKLRHAYSAARGSPMKRGLKQVDTTFQDFITLPRAAPR